MWLGLIQLLGQHFDAPYLPTFDSERRFGEGAGRLGTGFEGDAGVGKLNLARLNTTSYLYIESPYYTLFHT
jgi:hypothetical protein